MREHGTRACYVFGVEPGSDRSKGCRCDPCREANRSYARERDRRSRRVAYGIEHHEPPYIDAAEVRAHLRWLARQGIGLRRIAELTGLSRTTLARIGRDGRRCERRVTPATAEKILAVGRSKAAPGAYVPAAETWKLIDDLLAHGWTKAAISKAIGQGGRALQLGRGQVTARNARLVAELHSRSLVRVVAERELARERQRRARERRSA